MSANAGPTTVTIEEVHHIADLSNLRLTPDEATSMQRDLNAILNYVAELKQLDTSAVVPMAQVSEMLTLTPSAVPAAGLASAVGREQDSRATLRPDAPLPSLDRQQVMQSAPGTDEVFFKVPKVIER